MAIAVILEMSGDGYWNVSSRLGSESRSKKGGTPSAKHNAQYLGVENPLDLARSSLSTFASREPGTAIAPTSIKTPKTTL